MVSHDGSNYDYHFVKKELTEEFIKQFASLGKNITFTVLIDKEVTRIDKNGEESTNNICYILQFIDSARFMASLLSSLVNNISAIHRIKCKFGSNNKNVKHVKLNFLEYINFNDDLIKYKWFAMFDLQYKSATI